MGRLTQAFHYLKEEPSKLSKEQFTHITISEELKTLRKEMKLYKNTSKPTKKP